MKILFVIDPLEKLIPYKDTSVMMIQETVRRGWTTYIATVDNLLVDQGSAYIYANQLHTSTHTRTDSSRWYELEAEEKLPATAFDIIMMRKEPPFDMEFIYATYLLDIAANNGCQVVNTPASLRNYNEKCHITHFPEYTPATLITRRKQEMLNFITRYGECIIKPLDGMGGASIFRVKDQDPNKQVILETVSRNFSDYIMAQTYNPAIREGDKRILIVNGQPLEHVLARIPAAHDFRGNLASGATYEVQPLSSANRKIANDIGAHLQQNGVLFAGLDMIGDTLTEINITCPTCAREIQQGSGEDATALLFDALANKE